MAGSATSSARAISAVVSPARVRSVSATLASSGSAGMTAGEDQPQPVVGDPARRRPRRRRGRRPGPRLEHWPPARSFADSLARRRSTSTARLRAVVVSHAPGRCGTPSRARSAAPGRTRPARTPRRGPSRRSPRSAWPRPGPTPRGTRRRPRRNRGRRGPVSAGMRLLLLTGPAYDNPGVSIWPAAVRRQCEGPAGPRRTTEEEENIRHEIHDDRLLRPDHRRHRRTATTQDTDDWVTEMDGRGVRLEGRPLSPERPPRSACATARC